MFGDLCRAFTLADVGPQIDPQFDGGAAGFREGLGPGYRAGANVERCEMPKVCIVHHVDLCSTVRVINPG